MKRHAKAVPTATLSLVALLFSLLLFASPASASKGVVEVWGSSGTGPPLPGMSQATTSCLASDPDDCLSRPAGVAVNETTGDVYVADYSNARVVRLDENGVFERAWGWDVDADDPGTGFEICIAPAACQHGVAGDGVGQLDLPYGIAIDQSNGDVYVSNRGSGEKFDLDGNLIRAQNLGGLAPIATKPGSNSLLIGGGGLSWVDSSGIPLAGFSFGVPYSADSIAVDSGGEIYVAPAQDDRGSYPVLKLSAGGVSLGSFASPPGHGPLAVAVDRGTDHVFVSRFDRPVSGSHSNPGNAVRQLAEFDPAGNLVDLHATGMPRLNGPGLAVNSSTGRIYAAVGESAFSGLPAVDSRILVIDELTNPPVPTITSIASVTGSSATLNGIVNPQGTDFSTGYHWEYRKQDTQSWTTAPVPDIEVGNGTDPEPAGPEVISGLEPNTTYEVRLVATREGGAGFAIDTDSFTTLALPPSVTERSAYPVGDTTAQIRGIVHPRKSQTEYFFEWGRDESYGNTTPIQNAGAGNEVVPAYATVRGLQPETTYHFRLVADNGVGDPVDGLDREFTTRSTAEMVWAKRGIELVTPPDTGGQVPRAYISPVSDRVAWGTLTGSPGSPVGNASAFISERTMRTPTGWESRSLIPPINQLLGKGADTYTPVRAAPDFSSAIYKRVNDVEQNYVLLTSQLDQPVSQSIISSTPPPRVSSPEGAWSATEDLTHSFWRTPEKVLPVHTGIGSAVYDLSYDPPRLVSRLPNGSFPACGVPDGIGASGFMAGAHDYDWFSSASGVGAPLRLYFETPGSGNCEGPRVLYMRDDQGTSLEADDATHLVSGPPISGADQGAYFIRTNSAGTSVVYASKTRLDSDDANGNADIYKWTLGGGNDCLTCVVSDASVSFDPGNSPRVVVSADLRRVYFRSPNQLVVGKGQAGSPNNLYVLRDLPGGREIAYVGQADANALNQADGLNRVINQLSANGEVMVFKSAAPGTTPDRSGGFDQFYRYDDADGSMECLTCPPPGVEAAPAEGNFGGGFGAIGLLGLVPTKLLSADGSVFVFTSSAALVHEDINGSIDVYEANRDGRVRLVTDGVTRFSDGAGAPALQGISDDGKNILFGVGARLTGHEIDDVRQIYVARTGGGLPPPDPAADPCVEDACQGSLQAVPSFTNPGSSSLKGAPNPRQGKPAKGCARNKVRRGQRCVAKRKRAVCAKGKAHPPKHCKAKGKAKGRTKAGSERSAK